jgi:hypothetical protein
MTASYIPPGQLPPPPPPAQANSFIPPGSAPPPAPQPKQDTSRGNMSRAELTQVAQQVNHLNNRNAWRAICQTLGNAGLPPGPGFGHAAKAVWAERKAIRRATRAAGLPWRPLGKAQIRAHRRLSQVAH